MHRLPRLLLLLGLLALVTVNVASSPSGRAAAGAGTPVAAGYWLGAADGGIFGYGAPFHGSVGGRPLQSPIVAMAPTPSGEGYWSVASDGGVFAFGDARFFGSMGGQRLNRPIVGMAATAGGGGYWLVASDGGIFSFGDAGFAGSTGSIPLVRPIVGMASTPTGFGYWLVASDGGIFAFGDAVFRGSTGDVRLEKPVVGMAASGTGRGYWLVASDGGVFSYGDAPYLGSAGGSPLKAPIVAITPTPRGLGYWLVGSDGGVFTYGEAPFLGSAGGVSLSAPVVAMAARPVRLDPEVSAFFYPWYGTVARDGQWLHWNGYGHESAPQDIAADDYPKRAPYSSSDPGVLDAQMAEMSTAGITTVVTSWWGRGSFEDMVLPSVVNAARARGLRVAVHIEPYGGRTPGSVADDLARIRALGLGEAWVYEGMGPSAASWFSTAARFSDMRLYMHTSRLGDVLDGDFARYARGSGFDGVYTYDAIRFRRSQFAAACGNARRYRLICAPSVAPGFRATRTGVSASFVGRDNGARYDRQWSDVTAVGADVVSITSYNEWHEGTQIEPAVPYCFPDGYCSSGYDGAYGRTGAGAQTSYLDRTRDRALSFLGGG